MGTSSDTVSSAVDKLKMGGQFRHAILGVSHGGLLLE